MSTSLWAGWVEKTAWVQLVLSGMAALGATPSYNFALALWGVFCAYSSHGRAILTCVRPTLVCAAAAGAAHA